MTGKLLFSAFALLLLSGCVAQGGSYDRGYYYGQSYSYPSSYRRDYPAPRVYVVPRHYEGRRGLVRPPAPRYMPAPPPRHHYGQAPHRPLVVPGRPVQRSPAHQTIRRAWSQPDKGRYRDAGKRWQGEVRRR